MTPRTAARAPRTLVLLVLLSSVAAAAIGLLAHANADAPGTHPANLVHPGAEGPSASVIRRDFPGHGLPDGLGHDGQMQYAIARQPMHPDAVAADLDRPRYRLQRLAFPAMAWLLHPGGGGPGLVTALFAVGVAAVAAGTFATGALSVRLGGRPWAAVVFPLVPATYLTLRYSLADSLALAAALGAVALWLSGRHRWAVAAGILAVLTKESLLLVLVGFFLARPDRRRLALAVVPGAVAATWWLLLRVLVEDHSEGVAEFTPPFVGLIDAIRWWAGGHAPVSQVVVPAALLLGALALVRAGRHHPLWATIAIQLAFLSVLDVDVLGPDANGPRMTMPLLVLAALALLTPRARPEGHAAPEGAVPRLTAPDAAPAAGP